MSFSEAEAHLKKVDSKLGLVIEEIGACKLNFSDRSRFDVLASSIISQQLSIKAAHTIKKRVADLAKLKDLLEPANIVALEVQQLRSCGLSNAKAKYIRSLAENYLSGELNLDSIHTLSDEEIFELLIRQKGVGEWTAQMFMIFALEKIDILSTSDAGLIRSAQLIYGLENKPSAEQFAKIAEKWRPFRSVASWYLWRAID